ncbi:hypothetical protein RhiirC2_207847 [Rhizophagus irregularis]|uniref:Uncharacterized protein n=1 Tax=Rhizophagus irregularis TaxID=588596 RepID=A0A2N1MIP4_9GLOM|nr:hypothetical protein RhiirC2_207847 [Rhizophagus irregularis]
MMQTFKRIGKRGYKKKRRLLFVVMYVNTNLNLHGEINKLVSIKDTMGTSAKNTNSNPDPDTSEKEEDDEDEDEECAVSADEIDKFFMDNRIREIIIFTMMILMVFTM